MHLNSKIQVKHLVAISFIGILIYITISSISIYDSVFTGPTQKPKLTEWDSYLESRRKRNAKAMKLSYEDLMMIGQELMKEKNHKEAIQAYKFAKSIYPEAIDPRVQLCYIYLQLCQTNPNACNYAKREIYYAVKHVEVADKATKTYLDRLVDHTNLQDVIALEESAAMNSIF